MNYIYCYELKLVNFGILVVILFYNIYYVLINVYLNVG